MTKKQRALAVIDRLKKKYPDAICSLTYRKDYELLIATRLSAQCTDARVNVVTKDLFNVFPTVESFASAELTQVEDIVKPCGLYKTKAKSIVEMCKILVEKYDGKVPGSMEELLSLPGVGRKTANLIMGDVFHAPAIVCDTHCIRITNLLGLTDTKDPAKCEEQLRKILPPEESSDLCHRFVLFGRETCVARRPDCLNCVLKDVCQHGASLPTDNQ
ncbi:endonuclease III [Zongyangia hominis]|uniref:Endonuclease III n=1 Tax=Zongyangia hominis TaxID=2763677 RepID=A0A926IAZ1_9FIRM|nr:endonuclease III [Zongyangia hominis]MBC8569733.1 endonuclease III [Zongyangia hominis]